MSNQMRKASRILVTGASGMVGAALVEKLQQSYDQVISLTRQDCNLENEVETLAVFRKLKPEYVFHMAAKVGGIGANIADPAGFLRSNLLSQINVLEACRQNSSHKKLLLMGSSCIYPTHCSQPMKEEYLMTGPLEPTNEAYALAKIAGLKLGIFYHKQYKIDIVCPMPCNIYGPKDSFDLEHSHVLSALVKKFVDAKLDEKKLPVKLWGSGIARREFIFIDDVVAGIIYIMENRTSPEIINLGSGVDLSIKELATLIGDLVGYDGDIVWDQTKPDGMLKKLLDVSKMEAAGFKAKVSIRDGLQKVIASYQSQAR